MFPILCGLIELLARFVAAVNIFHFRRRNELAFGFEFCFWTWRWVSDELFWEGCEAEAELTGIKSKLETYTEDHSSELTHLPNKLLETINRIKRKLN